MRKLLVFAVACAMAAVGSESKAALVWGAGDYTPADWSPAENNLLLGNRATFDGKLYTESKCSEDPATVTDGEVPGASCDYKKIYGIADNSSLTWDLGVASDIKSLRVFTRWGDGGRSGIGISSVKVWYDGDADGTTLEGSALSYQVGQKLGASLYGILTNDTGLAIAENVIKLQVNFGHQDNSGTGYVEFEAVSASELKPTPAAGEFKPNSIGGTTQTFSAKVSSYGRFSSAATMTMELSTDAGFTTVISSDPVALSGDGDLNVERQLTVSGLQPDTLYYSRLKVVNEKEMTFVSEAQQYPTIDTLVCLGIGYVPTETGVKATVVISSMDTASATIDFYANGALVESRDISAAGNYDFDVTSSAATVTLRAEISYDNKTVTKEVTAQKGASGYVLPDPSAYATVATALKVKSGDRISLPLIGKMSYRILNHSFLSLDGAVLTAIKPGIVGVEVYGLDGTLAATMVVIVLPEKIGNGNIYIRAETGNQDWHSASNWMTVDGSVATDYPHNVDDVAIIPRLGNAQYFKVKEDISLGGLYVGIIKSGVNSTYYIQRADGVTTIPVVTFKRTDGEPVTIQICGNNQKDVDSLRTYLQFGDGNNKLGFKYESDTILAGGWDGVDAKFANGRPSYATNCTNEIPAGVTLTIKNIDTTGTDAGCTFAAPTLKGAGVFWNRSGANIRFESSHQSDLFTGVVRDSSHDNQQIWRSGPSYFYSAAVTNASVEAYGFVANSSGSPSANTSGVGMFCTGHDHIHANPGAHPWINWLPARGMTLVNSTYFCGSTEYGYGVGVAEYKYTAKTTVGRGFSFIYRNSNRDNKSGNPINWFETDALVHADKGTIRIDDYYRSNRDKDPGTSTNNVTILHGFNALAVGGTGDSQTAKNYPILPWAVCQSKHTGKLDFLCVDANERVCDRYAVDEKPSDVPTGEDANVFTWQRDLALSESKVFNALTICNNNKLKTMGAGKTLTLTSGGLILLENTSSIGTKDGGAENGALVLGDATKPGYVFALATNPNDPNCVYAPTTAQGGLVFGYTGYALLAGDQTGVDDELVVNAGTLDLGSQDKSVACTLDVPVRILANATVKMNNVSMAKSDVYFDDIAGYTGKIQLNANSTCQKLYVRDTPEETEWTSLPRGTYGATGSGATNIDDARFSGSGILTVRKDDLATGLMLFVR